jgi:transcriptional regulator with XRE-family HTH domain
MASISVVGKKDFRDSSRMAGGKIYPEIGLRIKKIRKLCKFSGRKRKAFAEELGIKEDRYERWERGASMPWQQAIKLIELARKFDVKGLNMDWIYRNIADDLPFELAERLGAIDDDSE